MDLGKEILEFFITFLIAFLVMKIILPEIIGIELTAVVSSSMEHREDIEIKHYSFLEKKYNYTREYINSWPFKYGFKVGDVLVAIKSDNYNIGDIVLYRGCGNVPISHRIVYKYDSYYAIKGDNNLGFLTGCINEEKVEKERIISKVVFVLPKIGYVRVLIYYLLGI
ncbi:MAG: hypothetical protein QXQ14_01530 [Candidatus Aenigmatarchaeota archaeon]